MKKSLLILVFLLVSVHVNGQDNTDQKSTIIEDFENERIGDLPENWFNQRGEARPINYKGDLRKTYNYTITEEYGNKFLRFEGVRGKHLNHPLVGKEGLNIYETPVLSWNWRIHDIPEGANEDGKNTNDVAASIYVVFDLGKVLFRKVPKSIRYTWSSTLPAGTELSHFYGNQKIIVMGSGTDGIGEWKTFERNIVEDYKRLFGDPPPEVPLAILILSDGDSTGKMVKADYDDILLKPSTID